MLNPLKLQHVSTFFR